MADAQDLHLLHQVVAQGVVQVSVGGVGVQYGVHLVFGVIVGQRVVQLRAGYVVIGYVVVGVQVVLQENGVHFVGEEGVRHRGHGGVLRHGAAVGQGEDAADDCVFPHHVRHGAQRWCSFTHPQPQQAVLVGGH